MSIDRFWILVARKLSGESSLQEIRELEELLRSHPHLYFSVEIINNLWNKSAIKDVDQLENAYAEHIARMKSMGLSTDHEDSKEEHDTPYILHGSRNTRIVRKISIAASILVLIAAGIFFYADKKEIPVKDDHASKMAVSTKNGSRTNIQLPDGSKVWLNSGSTLTYDKQFGHKIREVVLSGEAFFDVVKDPGKPFIIHTTSMDIKVLGTQFNVKSYANDKLAEASLIHGSIEVSLKKRGSEKFLLKPKEKILVMNDRIIQSNTPVLVKNQPNERIIAVEKLNYTAKDSTIIETSWVDHKLIFQNESFEDIAIKMERWYDITVRFEDEQLKNERLTGSFTIEPIDKALQALQISTAFHYTIRGNTIVITK